MNKASKESSKTGNETDVDGHTARYKKGEGEGKGDKIKENSLTKASKEISKPNKVTDTDDHTARCNKCETKGNEIK